MQRVSSEAKAADLHSSDLQAELRHQQEVLEEKDVETRRLQKVYTVQLHMLKGPVTNCIVPKRKAGAMAETRLADVISYNTISGGPSSTSLDLFVCDVSDSGSNRFREGHLAS